MILKKVTVTKLQLTHCFLILLKSILIFISRI